MIWKLSKIPYTTYYVSNRRATASLKVVQLLLGGSRRRDLTKVVLLPIVGQYHKNENEGEWRSRCWHRSVQITSWTVSFTPQPTWNNGVKCEHVKHPCFMTLGCVVHRRKPPERILKMTMLNLCMWVSNKIVIEIVLCSIWLIASFSDQCCGCRQSDTHFIETKLWHVLGLHQ